jgi:hypothetical protein
MEQKADEIFIKMEVDYKRVLGRGHVQFDQRAVLRRRWRFLYRCPGSRSPCTVPECGEGLLPAVSVPRRRTSYSTAMATRLDGGTGERFQRREHRHALLSYS